MMNKEKSNLNPSLIEEIPSSVIWYILSKLPIKACLNCKLVCKDWYQIIISPEFGDLRSSSCSSITILLHGKFYNKRKNFMLLDLDGSSKVDEMGNLSFDADALIRFNSKFDTSHDQLYVVNECNGIICLKSWEQWSPYIICNLLTDQQVIVEQIHKPSCSVEVYGLGCCPVSREFKVLRMLKTKESYKCVAEIQTLGTNKWRTLGGDAPLFQLRRSGAFLHGSLHRYSYRDNCIWSFHFGKERFSDIPVPDTMKRELYTEVSVFNSNLCFSSLSEKCHQCEIWLMKEYGVKGSWVKQFVVQIESFAYRMPLLELSTGELLVSYSNCVHLGVCDIESGRCKRVQIPGISFDKVIACNANFSKL